MNKDYWFSNSTVNHKTRKSINVKKKCLKCHVALYNVTYYHRDVDQKSNVKIKNYLINNKDTFQLGTEL